MVLLILSAIILYFLIVFCVADKNWLDIRAIFTGTWLGTIGLAALRLTEYQEVWQKKTWILLSISYLAFQIGAQFGINYGEKIFTKIKNCASKLNSGKIYFSLNENRLFVLALVTSLIGVACFVVSVAIKGFIPCFSNDPFAYINFYTKFHIFSVAATMSSGLCYYCIKTQPISLLKKVILWICIFYHVVLFPIMVVSRGVFVTAALTFTAIVFYLNKKRFVALLLCISMIGGVYIFTSSLRNLADDQLNNLFQPIEIELPGSDKDDKHNSSDKDDEHNDSDKDDDNDSSNKHNDLDTDSNKKEPTFMLSPKMAFLYGYFTVGHDNFNEAVQNLDEYTWGTRSLAPFNVILRSEAFSEVSASVDTYFVRPYLNTNNILGTFYYDFHEYGVIIAMLILAFLIGALQVCYEKFKSVFILLILGNTMQIGILNFFENFTARFEFWMFLGVILIFIIASCINIKRKNIKTE